MPDPSVSVVMPCFNAAHYLPTQLEALAGQRWSGQWEVVVADNGSTDGSREVVERYRDRLPDLRVVDASGRPGEAYACNVGVKASRAPAILFCHADDEVAPGWLEAMAVALSEADFVACSMDIEKLNAPWVEESHGNYQVDDLQRVPYPPHLLHAGGCSLGVRRSAFDAVGGFDEDLRYLCDTDFCFRAQLAGFDLQFVPDAVVHYRYRDSMRGLYQQAVQWAEGNVVLYKRYGQPPAFALRPWLTWARLWRNVVGIARRRPTRANRAKLCWMVGWQLGLLRGARRHRVPPAC